jgi:hypothetical protein
MEGERIFVATPDGYAAFERGKLASEIGFLLRDVEDACHA